MSPSIKIALFQGADLNMDLTKSGISHGAIPGAPVIYESILRELPR